MYALDQLTLVVHYPPRARGCRFSDVRLSGYIVEELSPEDVARWMIVDPAITLCQCLNPQDRDKINRLKDLFFVRRD